MVRSKVLLLCVAFAGFCLAGRAETHTVAGDNQGSVTASVKEVRLSLDGCRLDVNGQTEVPRALFGVHAVGITDPAIDDMGIECTRSINFRPSGTSQFLDKNGSMPAAMKRLHTVIDCEGDRYCEPTLLTDKNYQETFRQLGESYGRLWLQHGTASTHRGTVQFWNEPYLNWAERSAGSRGSTINQKYYETNRVDGGLVYITGWDTPLRHYRWRELWPVTYREVTDKKTGEKRQEGLIGWSVKVPPGLKAGDTFEAAEDRYWRNPGKVKTWVLESRWFPSETNHPFYWSGPQNVDFYMMMFEPYARGVRSINSNVTVLAGWDWNFEAGSWMAWETMYRPLIKAFPNLIDGMTEHHYGIPPERVQAWYEVGAADARALTGRPMKFWNTECQGKLDPAVYGNDPTGDESKLWEAGYSLCDILGLASRLPDKVGSRTVHNFAKDAFSDCGAAWALRLLKPLRGGLLNVQSDDANCWAVCAEQAPGKAVLAAYNHRTSPIRATVAARLPGGAATHATVRRLVPGETSNSVQIAEQILPINSQGEIAVEIGAQSAVVLLLSGTAGAGNASVRQRRQFFPKEGAVHRAEGGKPVVLSVAVPAGMLDGADKAFLRVVSDDVREPGVKVKVNDTNIAFARGLPVTDVAVPLSAIRTGENRLEFLAEQPFVLGAATLFLERTVKP